MQNYGYIRVSTLEQNQDRQHIALINRRILPRNIYTDRQSGKNTKRPGLQKLLSKVKRGDTVMVESVSRLSRNARDILELMETLAAKGVGFISHKENIDTTPNGKLMLTISGAIAEWERSITLERQAEGIAAARARGVHLGRPPKKLPENFGELVERWESGNLTLPEVLEQSGLKERTFYRRLKECRERGEK